MASDDKETQESLKERIAVRVLAWFTRSVWRAYKWSLRVLGVKW